MKTIFLSATSTDSGQTLLAWLLARELDAGGHKVGLYRPIGIRGSEAGEDHLLSLVFAAMGGRLAGSPVSPVLVDADGGLDPDMAKVCFQKAERAFNDLKGQCDVCLVVGSRDVFHDVDQSALPDSAFIDLFDAKVILLDRFRTKSMTVYSSLALSSFLGDRLAGVIINRVPFAQFDEFSGHLLPDLQNKGAKIFAALPEDLTIHSPTLEDIALLTGARFLCGDAKKDDLVAAKSISWPGLRGRLAILKRVVNKIILCGGNETQLDRCSLESLSGLLLTGGRVPPQAVIDAAESMGMAVMLTDLDTYSALEKLDKPHSYLKASDVFKLERLRQLLETQVSVESILKACGV